MKQKIDVPNNHLMEPVTEKEIDLRNIFLILMRRWWIIAAFTIFTTVLGFYYANQNDTALYQYTSRLIIYADQAKIETALVILEDPPILEHVIEELDIQQSPDSLSNQISANVVGTSQRVNLSVIDTSPERAVSIANKTAEVFQREIGKFVEISKVQVMEQTTVSPKQINGDNSNLKVAAILAGVIGGIGIVLLLNSLDNSLISEQDVIKALGVPVLGSVSKVNKKNTQRKKAKKQVVQIRGETIDS